MSEKTYELYDPKRFNVRLEEEDFSKQRNIALSLPQDVFYRLIDVISEELRQYFISLKNREDGMIKKMRDGGVITRHGILKYKIFKRLFVLDRVLSTSHFQDIYSHEWKSFKLRTYKPFVKPNTLRDFEQRYYAIFEILSFLVMNEGVVPYPHEVQRFCDRFKELSTKTDSKKGKKFWKELVEINKQKRQAG